MEEAFNCPHCRVYSHQDWFETFYKKSKNIYKPVDDLEIAFCTHCEEYSFWYEGKIIYPMGGNAPLPSSDLPKEIKKDFLEARAILTQSPRGAAALLRLAIQKLCIHLGEKGENLNKDISNLVKKGLSPEVQKSLDIVRVIGNDSVHPGIIDIKDKKKIAEKMFLLINIIVDIMITQPKQIDNIYKNLPDNKIKAINKRDKKYQEKK